MTDQSDESEQGVYERPGADQHDSAQPLDHRDLDDAQSAGSTASEDLPDEEPGGEDIDQ